MHRPYIACLFLVCLKSILQWTPRLCASRASRFPAGKSFDKGLALISPKRGRQVPRCDYVDKPFLRSAGKKFFAMYTVARGRAPRCDYIDDAIILGGFPWCCTQSLRIGPWWGLNKLVEITISKDVLTLITKQLNELTANMNLDLASSCPCWLAKPWWRKNTSSSRMICQNTSSGTHHNKHSDVTAFTSWCQNT